MKMMLDGRYLILKAIRISTEIMVEFIWFKRQLNLKCLNINLSLTGNK